jgi:hypothetical protein
MDVGWSRAILERIALRPTADSAALLAMNRNLRGFQLGMPFALTM